MSNSPGRAGSFNALIHEQVKGLAAGESMQINKMGKGKARVLEALSVSESILGHKMSLRVAADGSFWVSAVIAPSHGKSSEADSFNLWLEKLERFKSSLKAMEVGDEVEVVGGHRAEQQYCHQHAYKTGKKFVTRTSRRTGSLKIIRTE